MSNIETHNRRNKLKKRYINHNLTIFLEAAMRGNYTHAAEVLGMTQGNVSLSVKALERDVGATLFDRSRYGVTLTAEGERVHRLALQIADLEAAIGG